MSIVGDLVAGFFQEVLSCAAFHTARVFLRVISLGFIRVQGSSDSPYPDEPEFGWHNVIWKWDGKFLWLSNPFVLYFGLFLWIAALSALVYCWHAFS